MFGLELFGLGSCNHEAAINGKRLPCTKGLHTGGHRFEFRVWKCKVTYKGRPCTWEWKHEFTHQFEGPKGFDNE